MRKVVLKNSKQLVSDSKARLQNEVYLYETGKSRGHTYTIIGGSEWECDDDCVVQGLRFEIDDIEGCVDDEDLILYVSESTYTAFKTEFDNLSFQSD